METKNKIILIVYGVLCGLFILIVPWQLTYGSGYRRYLGYSFIAQPPRSGATIRVEDIIVHLVIITIIAIVAYFLAKKFIKQK